jgi:methylenetetrahydrofolate reductase (NADPH)
LNTYLQAFAEREFVLSAELPLKPGMSATDVVADAGSLFENVDGVVLTDNQYGVTHMSTTAAASLLIGSGIDPIVQLSCRNRNRTALVSELLGTRALGVTSLLLIEGAKVPKGFEPRPKSVLDMNTKELIATAQLINEDEKISGEDAQIITTGTVHQPQPGWEPEEMNAKADAGATIIVTQLCFDADLLRRYMSALVAKKMTHRLQFIVSLATLPSAHIAEFLRDNRRRALIPPAVIKRLQQSLDAEAEGVAICSELLQQYAEIPGIRGVNLMTLGSVDTIGSAVNASGIRSGQV